MLGHQYLQGSVFGGDFFGKGVSEGYQFFLQVYVGKRQDLHGQQTSVSGAAAADLSGGLDSLLSTVQMPGHGRVAGHLHGG